MKNTKTLLIQGATLIAGMGMIASLALPVFAQAASTPKTHKTPVQTQAKGTAEIQTRIKSLNDFDAKITTMVNLSATDKSTLSSNLQAEVTDLTNLETKITADTAPATIKTDTQSVTKSYRVYALVLPQARITAAADRAITVANMINAVGTKLQARIAAAPAGTNTTAWQSALTDLQAKTADAISQAHAAVALITPLVPDQGNKTTAASNAAAIKSARADLKTATTDLTAAHKDAQLIVSGLATLKS